MSKKLDRQIAELKKASEELDKKVAEAKLNEENSEKVKEEVAPPPKPYVVFGRGFTATQPNIIEYYQNRLEMMVFRYKLVGRFDLDGQYSIPKEVKYELIQMQKSIEEMGSDYYKVSALYMKKYFNFTIKLTMLDDGKAKASLSIAEYAGLNVDGETIYTHIGDFIDDYDENYRIKLRRVFNLVDADAKNDDFKIPTLAVLMQDLIDTDLYIGELYDMASQIYVIRMLKLLAKGGEVEKQIIERYKELLSEMKDEPEEENGKDKFKIKPKKLINERYKELLDKSIDEKGGLEKLKIDKKEFADCVDELNKTDKAIGELTTTGAGVLDIEEIKSIATKKEGDKGSSSSSSPEKKPQNKKPQNKGAGKSAPGKGKPKSKKDDDSKGKKKNSGGGVYWETPKDKSKKEGKSSDSEKTGDGKSDNGRGRDSGERRKPRTDEGLSTGNTDAESRRRDIPPRREGEPRRDTPPRREDGTTRDRDSSGRTERPPISIGEAGASPTRLPPREESPERREEPEGGVHADRSSDPLDLDDALEECEGRRKEDELTDGVDKEEMIIDVDIEKDSSIPRDELRRTDLDVPVRILDDSMHEIEL